VPFSSAVAFNDDLQSLCRTAYAPFCWTTHFNTTTTVRMITNFQKTVILMSEARWTGLIATNDGLRLPRGPVERWSLPELCWKKQVAQRFFAQQRNDFCPTFQRATRHRLTVFRRPGKEPEVRVSTTQTARCSYLQLRAVSVLSSAFRRRHEEEISPRCISEPLLPVVGPYPSLSCLSFR
jgi:hypothetical protein